MKNEMTRLVYDFDLCSSVSSSPMLATPISVAQAEENGEIPTPHILNDRSLIVSLKTAQIRFHSRGQRSLLQWCGMARLVDHTRGSL